LSDDRIRSVFGVEAVRATTARGEGVMLFQRPA
jgi:hypothetical protein